MKKLLLATAAAVLLAGPAAAQTYPDRTVTIIAPFAPGGIIDIASRIVGEALTNRWGQQVIVENRAGGSGFIGAQAAKQADPDGYTLFAAESGVSLINELIFPSVPYAMMEDFIPITTMSDTPIVLAAHKGTGVTTMAQFIEATRAKPHNFSSPANGTLNHLAGEWIAVEGGLQLDHIGYRGGAPAATALASGEVPFGVLAYSSVLPFVQSGDVTMLATTSAERVAANPNLPTVQEAGIANVDASQWSAMYAPAGTPKEVVEFLHAEITAVLNDPAVKERFAKVGASTIPQSQEDFRAMLDGLREDFASIVKAAGVTAQ